MGFWKTHYKGILQKSAIWSIFFAFFSAADKYPNISVFFLIGVYIGAFIGIFFLFSIYYYVKGSIKIIYKKLKKK